MSSQSGQKVLRIGLIQNGKIIEERLMRSMKPVTIGSALEKNELVVPASDLPKSMTVFDVSNGRYVLHFTSKMSGRVSLGDGVVPLEELISKGKAKKTAQGFSVELPPNGRGKVVIGEVTLLFQFVTAPAARPKPVLPASMRGGWGRGMDRALGLIILLSAILQIGFVVYLETQHFLIEDIEYVFPTRFVQISVDKDEEEPPKVEVEVTDGDGPSVETEEPVATKSEDKGKESPEEMAEDRARERTMKAVEDKTLLRVLGAKGEGGSVVDTLLNGVGNISAEEAFANSTGVQHAEAGVERSGIRGKGSPDGDGVGARAGIDELGAMKGAKKAQGGVDTGQIAERQVKARPIKIQDPNDMAGGTLDNKTVSTAIRRRQAAIQACYERELRRNHQAGGRVVINFTISARGSRGAVTQAKAVVDDVGGGVGQCVANEIQNLRGLPAPDGGDVIINMPFVFQPGQ
ncbi:MAG: AgmX/PglI C-terminal domain-containing protein [Bradymonadaceae bacterium]|nr:AgmX/PglI C-terminal domain-containing protein [Lujinxingiaceae bacterium]